MLKMSLVKSIDFIMTKKVPLVYRTYNLTGPEKFIQGGGQYKQLLSIKLVWDILTKFMTNG